MEYPKIETLYDRGRDFKVKVGHLRRKEFGVPQLWLVTEKIDGTNIRITVTNSSVEVGGRTNKAENVPDVVGEDLLLRIGAWHDRHFGNDAESPTCVLYGEGYGEKIQSGGGYRSGVNFRLFDVRVGEKFLDWTKVEMVAEECDLDLVPVFGQSWSEGEVLEFLSADTIPSRVATWDGGPGKWIEGVVCRTDPLLYDWKGNRIMWKLKLKDFG